MYIYMHVCMYMYIYICTQTSVLTDGYQKSASNCDWSFYPRCARACPRGRNSSCTCLVILVMGRDPTWGSES